VRKDTGFSQPPPILCRCLYQPCEHRGSHD
jgi:hypothetical protein